MEEDFFKIRLKLVDKYFPYNCKRTDEGIVRKAATNFTEKYLLYSSYYSKADFERTDLLMLVGFHFSLALLINEKQEDMLPMLHTVERLNDELDVCIRSFE